MSTICISNLFKALREAKASPQQVQATAEQVLLSPADVEMWLQHLSMVQLNRKRGAAKAAITRRKKKEGKPGETVSPPAEGSSAEIYRCGVCSEVYEDETVEEEPWIQCDKCMSWFHGDCVGVNPSRVPDTFFCDFCFSHK